MLSEKDQKRIEKLVDTFIAADAAEKTAREIKDKVKEELNRYHLAGLWEARDIKHNMKCKGTLGEVSICFNETFSNKDDNLPILSQYLVSKKQDPTDYLEIVTVFNHANMDREEVDLLFSVIKKMNPERKHLFLEHKKRIVSSSLFHRMIHLSENRSDFDRCCKVSGIYKQAARIKRKRNVFLSEILNVLSSYKEKAPFCPACGSIGVTKVEVSGLSFPFWKCDKCRWSICIEEN